MTEEDIHRQHDTDREPQPGQGSAQGAAQHSMQSAAELPELAVTTAQAAGPSVQTLASLSREAAPANGPSTGPTGHPGAAAKSPPTLKELALATQLSKMLRDGNTRSALGAGHKAWAEEHCIEQQATHHSQTQRSRLTDSLPQSTNSAHSPHTAISLPQTANPKLQPETWPQVPISAPTIAACNSERRLHEREGNPSPSPITTPDARINPLYQAAQPQAPQPADHHEPAELIQPSVLPLQQAGTGVRLWRGTTTAMAASGTHAAGTEDTRPQNLNHLMNPPPIQGMAAAGSQLQSGAACALHQHGVHDGMQQAAGQAAGDRQQSQQHQHQHQQQQQQQGQQLQAHVYADAGGGLVLPGHDCEAPAIVHVTAAPDSRKLADGKAPDNLSLHRSHAYDSVPDALCKQQQRQQRRQQKQQRGTCSNFHMGRMFKNVFLEVWSPRGYYRMLWDMFVLICMQYVIYVTPYIVAFNLNTSDLHTPLADFDLAINCIFMADVLVNFNTAYLDDDGEEVRSRWRIAQHYACTWLVLDVATSLPWDNMFGDKYTLLKALRLLRLARFVRSVRQIQLLRLSGYPRIRNLMMRLDEVAGHHMMRIAVFIWTACSLVHWAACTFYFVARMYGPDADTWISESLESNSPYVVRYVSALYWAVATMTTVGYGDITGITVGEQVVSILTMVVGASLFAYLMGSMASILASLNSTNARASQKKAAVTDFVRHNKLPRRLADKIHNYYGHVLQQQAQGDEHSLVDELPRRLRMQVKWHLHQEILKQIPFFQGKPRQFIVTLVSHLSQEFYGPGDVVVRQGNLGREMFFIISGEVELRLYEERTDHGPAPAHPDDDKGNPTHAPTPRRRDWRLDKLMSKVMRKRHDDQVELLDEDLEHLHYRKVGVLEHGDYFGEGACIYGDARVATAVALDFTELYSLSGHDLEEVLQEYPKWWECVEELTQLPDPHGGEAASLEDLALRMRRELGMPDLVVPSHTELLAAASVALNAVKSARLAHDQGHDAKA